MSPKLLRERAHEFWGLFKAGEPGTIDHLRTYYPEAADLEDDTLQRAGLSLREAFLIVGAGEGYGDLSEIQALYRPETDEAFDSAISTFVEVVAKGDLAGFKQLLADAPFLELELDTPRHDCEGSALIQASVDGHLELVEALNEAGADIHMRTIFWARAASAYDLAPPTLKPRLIELGALPEITTFVEAIRFEKPDELRACLAAHNVLRRFINQPLFSFGQVAVGAARKNRALIEVLLDFGADLNGRSWWDAGSFGVLDNNTEEMARYLISRGATVDIHAACEYGMMNEVERLIREDPACVQQKGGDGKSPLHTAASVEIADYLLDHGAEIDALDEDHGSSAAQWQLNNPDVCRRLIERGAAVDIFMATALGELERVKQLLEQEPETLNARTHQPPYSNTREEAPNIYNWRIGFRKSPHEVAHERGFTELYAYLMDQSSEREQFINACMCADPDRARAIHAAHPDWVGSLEARDRVRFVDAAWNNNIAAVRLMLELGFDVNERDDEGPALVCASVRGNLDILKLLLAYHPDLSAQNIYGGDALGACVWGSKNWDETSDTYSACIQCLVDAGMHVKPVHLEFGSDKIQDVLNRNMTEEDS